MSHFKNFKDSFSERIENACKSLIQGKGVILIDDESRENEGDLIFSAKNISVSDVNQLIQDCSGIICLCLTQQKADSLSLKPMITENTSAYQTAFTVSIEAKTGVTTGVSAYDRWKTISTAITDNASAIDIRQPGHVFPLIANKDGVLKRRGHTEGSVDLMNIAKLPPYAVLCELMNKDGSMQKLPELIQYSKKHDLPILTVEDIYQYRITQQQSGLSETVMPIPQVVTKKNIAS
ncbi:MAG: 3,4-dihydroxy-2-butanone-4-phosphate synthase [Legionellaceae bacterium]|nr:3,4-dihydroxy-2-butanone-4-phosphate synthase [Legionellaceae bacterium]